MERGLQAASTHGVQRASTRPTPSHLLSVQRRERRAPAGFARHFKSHLRWATLIVSAVWTCSLPLFAAEEIIRTNQPGFMESRSLIVMFRPGKQAERVAVDKQGLDFGDGLHTLSQSRATVRLNDGKLVPIEINREVKDGIVRELEVGAVMSIETATLIRDWLNEQIAKLAGARAERTQGGA